MPTAPPPCTACWKGRRAAARREPAPKPEAPPRFAAEPAEAARAPSPRSRRWALEARRPRPFGHLFLGARARHHVSGAPQGLRRPRPRDRPLRVGRALVPPPAPPPPPP